VLNSPRSLVLGCPMNGLRTALKAGVIGLLLAGTSWSGDVSAAPNKSAELEQLRSQLQSDDRQIRGNAIVALGKLGEAAVSVAPLIVEQLADAKERVTVLRWKSPLAGHAERALLLIGPGAVPALSAGLHHENVEIRSRCALVLGRIGGVLDDAVIARLIELLGDLSRLQTRPGSHPLEQRHRLQRCSRKTENRNRYTSARSCQRLAYPGVCRAGRTAGLHCCHPVDVFQRLQPCLEGLGAGQVRLLTGQLQFALAVQPPAGYWLRRDARQAACAS